LNTSISESNEATADGRLPDHSEHRRVIGELSAERLHLLPQLRALPLRPTVVWQSIMVSA
jgi:hypothetical protein